MSTKIIEEMFANGLSSTQEGQYYVCRKFDILLRKRKGKFYPAINHENLAIIRKTVSSEFYQNTFNEERPDY
jgi:hypothetical protein